jgi:hypothetical protein
VILEHSVLGLHTCLVPVFLPSSLLLCITCLVPALQYTPLHLLSAFIYLVCITSTSILASLRCTCFVIAWQISPCAVDIQGKPIIVHIGHYGQPTVTAGVKAKVVDPCKYQMLDVLLTCRKRRLLETEDTQLQDPYRQHHHASNITEALPTFHSASKKTATKRRRGISRPISILPTPL